MIGWLVDRAVTINEYGQWLHPSTAREEIASSFNTWGQIFETS